MLMLISPAKKQDYDFEMPLESHTIPKFKTEAATLVKTLRTYNSKSLQKLMSISEKLGDLNVARYKEFNTKNFAIDTARPAAYAFRGDVYQKLRASDFSAKQALYMQDHLIILSGLYGFLKALDLIQPHRLEMGSQLPVKSHKNLYEFWGNKITKALNEEIAVHGHKQIINLASKEYFQSVDFSALSVPVYTIEFKEQRGDKFKTFGMNAKRARGMMARYVIENKISTITALKQFNSVNYTFNDDLSTDDTLCFTRPE
jgi:cytoplasmic iron level regulating protein YaaA (DUF328/UPF0246 family)